MSASPGSALILVENLPVPLDRRVWMEATTLQQEGWDVTVVCPMAGEWTAREESLDGVRILRHPMPPEGRNPLGFLREYAVALLHEWRLVRRAWRRQPFDVIHLCNPPDLLFTIAAWYRIRHGVKVVFDQHDLGPELFVAKYGRRGLLHRILVLCERLTFATAHQVISTNESYRQIALTRGGKSPDEVTVVRSAPQVEGFTAVPPDERYRDGSEHLLGYVGVMGDQEGIDLLLRAVRHIVVDQGRSGVRLMAIGGGPALSSLKDLVAELGIADAVEFTGRVPDEELIARLSTVDVCVAPDPRNGFNELCTMNKVMEYMALGKPIVQFDLEEGRRSAGGASVYATPNDPVAFAEAVLGVLDGEPAERELMAAVGRSRMEDHLGWHHQRQPLLDAYASLVASGGARQAT